MAYGPRVFKNYSAARAYRDCEHRTTRKQTAQVWSKARQNYEPETVVWCTDVCGERLQ